MRRDLCYFLPADVNDVYRAFLTAAQNPPFERTCTEEHPYIFSFGLNFSMKYNMNGGACTLRFMPCYGGSAVNIRFSIAQAAGARYEKYALDLLSRVTPLLGIGFQPSEIPIEAFVDYAEKGIQSSAHAPVQAPEQTPVQAPVQAPIQAPVQAPAAKACAACGQPLVPNAKFCSACGARVQEKRVCTACGTELSEKALFCHNCGKRA